MAQAKKDNNSVASLIGVSSVDGVSTVPVAVDPTTGRLLVDLAGSGNLTIGTSTITSGTTGLLLYDNGGVVGELALATYPSLTELSYVKGVTSGIQSQLNGKLSSLSGALLATGGTTGATSVSQVFTLGATLSNITLGSVLFAGTAGVISQDNTNLFWDNTNKQLQIGGVNVNSASNLVPLNVTANLNDYEAIAIQNKSNGDSASTDIYASADNDVASLVGHYTDMGVYGSGFSASAIGNIKTISLNAGGTGYTANDVVTISTGDANATATVLTVNGSGVILTISLFTNGTGYSTGSAIAVTGGTGSGGKVNILTLLDNSIYSANDGYLYCSGGNLIISTDTLAKEIVFSLAGLGATNEMARLTATQLKVGLTGTTLGKVFFSGNTSTGIILQGQAVGSSSVLTLPVATDTLVGKATTDTLTNKRITPRILSAASYTTDTGTSINGDTLDMFIVTAQATTPLKFNNPTGTPTDGQKLIISVASSTTSARALTWDTAYGATTVALPTTTTATTATLTMGFIWSASKSLWQIVATA